LRLPGARDKYVALVAIDPNRLTPVPSRRIPSRAVVRLLLLVIVLMTFGRTLLNDFVDWDDGTLIYNNPNITGATLHGLARQWNWRDPNNFGLYDPLVYTTWWVLAHAGRLQTPDSLGASLNPQVFHAANLIVHWLSGCVAFEILSLIGLGRWPGFLGTLLFLVHPLQTEAVAWATGLKDLLGGLLVLACVWRYLVAIRARGLKRRSNYLAATILCACALLAKPSAAALPLIVFAFERVLYQQPLKQSLIWLSPWLVMSIVAAAITVSIQPVSRFAYAPWWGRPLIMGESLAFYLGKIVWPIHLNFDYGRTPNVMLHEPGIYWNWIFPAILALVVWRMRQPVLTVAALIFLFSVLPVLGLVPFFYQYYSTVADRYVYVSMFGVGMAAAVFLTRYSSALIWFPAGGVLVILMCLSFLQAGRWKDTETLYSYGMSINQITAGHYETIAEYKEKEASLALRHRDMAVDEHKAFDAHTQDMVFRDDLRHAVDYRRREIACNPMDSTGHDQLAIDLDQLGDHQAAIDMTRHWLADQSSLPVDQRDDAGNLHALLGQFYFDANDYPQSVREFKKSLALEPDLRIEVALQAATAKMQAASQP
jgi:tetratricopeptide (TPR) repeat protein